ncbi:hypothetical protein [Enterococcus casseliflavus]|uniref:hypothetical protein n=1 Tax=Enterococcus casseliflavus TaxID=37734 RepID=UPI0035DCBCD4
MKIKRKYFHTVMNYSKYLDYYLYIISNKSYERIISQEEVNELKKLVDMNAREKILKRSKKSFFKTHVIIPREYKDDFLSLSKIGFYLKEFPESNFIDFQ